MVLKRFTTSQNRQQQLNSGSYAPEGLLLGRRGTPAFCGQKEEAATGGGDRRNCEILPKLDTQFTGKDSNTDFYCLQRSAAEGNLAGCVEWVKKGVTPNPTLNTSKKCSLPALMFAASLSGSLECCDFLLNNGAKVNAKDQSGSTALHHAAWIGKHEIVSLLLSKGAIIDTQNLSHGATALMTATCGNSIECVRTLLRYNASVQLKDTLGRRALHFACAKGHLEIVHLLLKNASDLEQGLDCLLRKDSRGQLPLHKAAQHGGDPEIIRTLLTCRGNQWHRAFATEEVYDNDGLQPLHLAALHCRRENCRVIIEATIPQSSAPGKRDKSYLVNLKTRDGSSVLLCLAEADRDLSLAPSRAVFIDCAKLLLSLGADIGARNSQGRTAYDLVFSRIRYIQEQSVRREFDFLDPANDVNRREQQQEGHRGSLSSPAPGLIPGGPTTEEEKEIIRGLVNTFRERHKNLEAVEIQEIVLEARKNGDSVQTIQKRISEMSTDREEMKRAAELGRSEQPSSSSWSGVDDGGFRQLTNLEPVPNPRREGQVDGGSFATGVNKMTPCSTTTTTAQHNAPYASMRVPGRQYFNPQDNSLQVFMSQEGGRGERLNDDARDPRGSGGLLTSTPPPLHFNSNSFQQPPLPPESVTSSAETTCNICFCNPIDHRMEPCGHTMCGSCLSQLLDCPFCRATIGKRVKLLE